MHNIIFYRHIIYYYYYYYTSRLASRRLLPSSILFLNILWRNIIIERAARSRRQEKENFAGVLGLFFQAPGRSINRVNRLTWLQNSSRGGMLHRQHNTTTDTTFSSLDGVSYWGGSGFVVYAMRSYPPPTPIRPAEDRYGNKGRRCSGARGLLSRGRPARLACAKSAFPAAHTRSPM